MGSTIAQKIIRQHLVSGDMVVGEDVGLKIDQTLTQDATGTMAYLEFEAMGVPRVKTERSVAYIDHNTLQSGFENADDHRFIQSIAKKHGIYFSRPGNGICHQLHLERFGIPGKTLIGSDSHTPTGGGIGMLAFGAGGLDVAVAMGGGEYHINMPKMTKINLVGRLSPWVSAKDVILAVLQKMSVKGGVGKIIEYGGEGIMTLTVPERATITNMGTELGATTSIFPSDEITKAFLEAQGRGDQWAELKSDPDAVYDEEFTISPGTLGCLPPQPGRCKACRGFERHQGGPGVHWLLHQLLLFGHDARGRHLKRQDRAPGRKPHHWLRLEAGVQHAGFKWRFGRYHRCGGPCFRVRLRALHWHGPVAQFRRRVPAYL